MSSTTILLTGGNGFIAVHTVVLLLQRGYTITTTVRSEAKTAYLRKRFSDAVGSGQLKLAIVQDITVPGAFDEVLKNNTFDAVIHTSSPVVFEAKDVERDILVPAIQGTTKILKAVKVHASTVKRVVVTSSAVAILDLSKGARPGYVYDEKDWNPVGNPHIVSNTFKALMTGFNQLTFEQAQENARFGYAGSKIYAEKAAWEFMDIEKPSFDLVTICPPMVYGPVIQEVTSMASLNLSSKKFYAMFSGQEKELSPDVFWLWVDVRDVAEAHVAAIEKPEAGGQRFFVTAGSFNVAQVVRYIWEHYPERALAKGIPKDTSNVEYPPGGFYTADNSASKRVLELEYRPLETMLKDQLDQFLVLEKEIESSNN
ncbi:methylglyoxal reductase (NADPH-dependent) gre2 [Ceratobasidium sp. 428]|nr:methylglyoxal reductase (NADPH-dependent) gre2 [Ceratobasidium sp. 428]